MQQKLLNLSFRIIYKLFLHTFLKYQKSDRKIRFAIWYESSKYL